MWITTSPIPKIGSFNGIGTFETIPGRCQIRAMGKKWQNVKWKMQKACNEHQNRGRKVGLETEVASWFHCYTTIVDKNVMDSLTEQLRMANESSSQFAVTSIHGICQDAEWSESICKSVERHKPNVAPLLCCHLATRNDTKQHRPTRKPMWQWNKGKGWGSILHFCIIGLMVAHTLSYSTTLHSITTSQHVCMIFSFKSTNTDACFRAISTLSQIYVCIWY